MSTVLRDRVRAGKHAALRNLASAAVFLLATGVLAWVFVPALSGLGPGFVAAGALLALSVPVLLVLRGARVLRHARRESAFLTLLDGDAIRRRGNDVISETVASLKSRLSPESSLTVVLFDDRRTGMMTLTVTELHDGGVTVHPMPAGTVKRIVGSFCAAFPPTLPWHAYLLCLPQREASVRHLMLDASETKALGISTVDAADSEAMTRLHHLPL